MTARHVIRWNSIEATHYAALPQHSAVRLRHTEWICNWKERLRLGPEA